MEPTDTPSRSVGRRRRLPGVAFVAAALLVAAASASQGGEEPSGWTGALGDPAPALELSDLEGRSVRLEEHAGRAVLINLWATYCLPCRHEMPLLDELAQEHPDDLVVLGISLDGPSMESRVRDLGTELAISYPLLLDPEGRASRLFEAPALPASYLFGRSGRLVWKRLGVIVENDADFAAGLEAALAGDDEADGDN